MEYLKKKLPFELCSQVGLLSNDLDCLFEYFKDDKSSYVTLCKLYPWTTSNPDHWYEHVMMYGTPIQMRYLYKLYPTQEFVERYWMECIDHDILDFSPVPKNFGINSFYRTLELCSYKVAQVCYDVLPKEDKNLIYSFCITACGTNHRSLQWILEHATKEGHTDLFNRYKIPDNPTFEYLDLWSNYCTRQELFYIKNAVLKASRTASTSNVVQYRLPCYN